LLAARILGQAGAGEILVSRTVRDLVVGSGIAFRDRGVVELRGVTGIWELVAVDRHGARTGSREADLAAAPTPGPRDTMRRSDRAMAIMVKRTHRGSSAGWRAWFSSPTAVEPRALRTRR